MARKLLLTMVGIFFPSKGPMCVACALLISVAFLVLHALYMPFHSATCNTLQGICMAVLSLLYFCGMLIKVDSVDQNETAALGNLLITMLIFTAIAILGLLGIEAKTAKRTFKDLYHAWSIKFEGQILHMSGCPCISSFPGKFENGWNAVVGTGKLALMSVACVFLPKGTPKFGQHANNPDTPGKCFCYSLYGEKKGWGCMWFRVWADLVEEAVSLKQRLTG